MNATQLFTRTFHRKPARIVRCPARVELLGNHTDYNLGLVLAACVDLRMELAWAPRTDGRVAAVSGSPDNRAAFRLSTNLKPTALAPWSDFIKGMVAEAGVEGIQTRGFDIAITSTIPQGGGLSSSAALLLSTGIALLGEIPESASARLKLARWCQRVENRFMGVQCGLLDYLAILHGTAGRITQLDFKSLRVTTVPCPRDYLLVLADSGVRHRLSGGGYNAISDACIHAARHLQVPSLRDTSLAAVERARNAGSLGQRELEVARHVLRENLRVQKALRSLKRADAARVLGACMHASHESSRDALRNSCDELDVLVRIAMSAPDASPPIRCFGSRLTGGGFGGMTVSLVHQDDASRFRHWMRAGWKRETGAVLPLLQCRSTAGPTMCTL